MVRSGSEPRKRLTANQLMFISLALGLTILLVFRLLQPQLNRTSLSVAVLLFAAAGVPITIIWGRRLGEAAREAHRWAWYWGATSGLFVAIPGLIALFSSEAVVRLARRFGFESPEELIGFGVVAVLLFQLAGYLIAWAVWWLRRR